MTALLLETFGLIGFGHLYAGRFLNAFFKLIVFYAIICFGFQFVIQLLKENSDSDLANYIKIGISISCFGTPIIWHFLDCSDIGARVTLRFQIFIYWKTIVFS